MSINIVVRAADPAGASEVARALGINLKDPNRPNPEAWHFNGQVSIVVTHAHGGAVGISVGLDKFDASVGAAITLLGEDAVRIGADRDTASIDIPGVGTVDVERDAQIAEYHDVHDIGGLYTVAPMIERHRSRILDAIAQVGATDPRLVGPNLGRVSRVERQQKHWTWFLVVDAPEDIDLAPLQNMLTELQDHWAPITVRRSTDFDAKQLARINKRAFDI